MLCILLALAGIAMLARTADGGKLSTLGITLVMISALAFSGYVVAVNKSRLRQIAPLKLTFYVLLFGLSLFFVRVDFGRSLYILQEWHLWANVLALSLFPTIVSFVCTTRAIHSIGSTATSVLGALEPVTAIFFGVTIFHEQLTPRMMLGVAMIIAAVTMIIAEGNIKTYLMALRKMRPKLPLKRIQKTKKK